MTRPRPTWEAIADRRLNRWLWYLTAYLAVIVLLAWLAHYLGAPVAPSSGWAE